MLGAVEHGEESAVKFYKEWKEEVEALVPPERLLVWHPREGWEPLCTFLGVEQPIIAFPNVNDTASIQKNVRMMKLIRFVFWSLVFLFLISIAYLYVL